MNADELTDVIRSLGYTTWGQSSEIADKILAAEAVAAAQRAAAAAQRAAAVPLVSCAAGRDGDCTHTACPQSRDSEPHATGRHCPLDKGRSDL